MVKKSLIVVAEKEDLILVDELNKVNTSGIPILITGVGALNVMNALRDVPRDTRIINIGYAGSKNLPADKFYEVSYVTLHHPNVDYPEPVYYEEISGQYTAVPCYSGCDFVPESDKNSCLFDMELAFINALGFDKVSSFKYVIDNIDLYGHGEGIK